MNTRKAAKWRHALGWAVIIMVTLVISGFIATTPAQQFVIALLIGSALLGLRAIFLRSR